jgi:hypothetical protein
MRGFRVETTMFRFQLLHARSLLIDVEGLLNLVLIETLGKQPLTALIDVADCGFYPRTEGLSLSLRFLSRL